MRFTLPKSQILRGRGAFSRVLSTGKAITSAPVRCSYLYDPSGDGNLKVGFAVSRSVSNVPIRNQIKRQMREGFRTHRHLLIANRKAFTGSIELVFLYTESCKEKLTRLENQRIESAIIKCLRIIGEQKRGS